MLISREIIPTYVISIPHRHRRTDRKLCRITLLVSGYFAVTPTRRKKFAPHENLLTCRKIRRQIITDIIGITDILSQRYRYMAYHYSLAIRQAFWKLPDVTHCIGDRRFYSTR